MKRTSNRVKYWVIYDIAYSGGDEGIGWTSNSFIAKTYFIFRKKSPNKDTVFIEELDKKEDIKPFILSIFPKIYDEFSDDYGEKGINLFDDLELKKFSFNGKYTITTDAYITKCEMYECEVGAFDHVKQCIEKYVQFIRKHAPYILNESLRNSLLELAHTMSCYCIVMELRFEYFDYCYYGFCDDSEEFADFKSARDACLSMTGIDLICEDGDIDFTCVGVLNNIAFYEYFGMLCWIGDDDDEK